MEKDNSLAQQPDVGVALPSWVEDLTMDHPKRAEQSNIPGTMRQQQEQQQQ